MGVLYKGRKYCSKNFSWDDLIGCSETYKSASVANIPKQPATYEALSRLSEAILEPVLERYGTVKLTLRAKAMLELPLTRQMSKCGLRQTSKC